ncbi:two-component system response regulator [Halomicronema hongdechloris C2206]|uniref:Two-component system response regulator n=1 Tax=Halomicronema hongdechloris C2206 TaxID=1641165 RepID=A0A1Z3HK93_9CYAN|nr:response regulator [Halomicronema hongdechloris]ASC70731.1 two-component system response regulator [Halomicronema hongdechloris C2206]
MKAYAVSCKVALRIWRVGQALTAASGREGIVLAKSAQPDVILLDVIMPDMDGAAVFQALQNDTRAGKIPVLFLTAQILPSDHQTLLDLGATGVITKPFTPSGLLSQIAKHLNW